MADSSDPHRRSLQQAFSRLADDLPDGELEAAILVSRALNAQLDPELLRQRIRTSSATIVINLRHPGVICGCSDSGGNRRISK